MITDNQYRFIARVLYRFSPIADCRGTTVVHASMSRLTYVAYHASSTDILTDVCLHTMYKICTYIPILNYPST